MAKQQNQQNDTFAGATPNTAYRTALASIKLLREASVMDLTEDDYDFLVQPKVWLPVDRSRARRCIEAAVYGALDYVGFPRFPAPVEFISAAIASFVHPVNVQIACVIMEGAEFSEHIINGVSIPVKPAELFAHVLRVLSGDGSLVDNRTEQAKSEITLQR